MPDDPLYTDDLQYEEAYYRALGCFVHTFSLAENELKVLMGRIAGMPSARETNAVFSGVRAKGCMDNIRRIHEARGDTPDPAYECIREQFGHILAARDSIVHHGARFAGGKPSEVSNNLAAHAENKVRSFPVSAGLVDDMVADLEVIRFYLRAALWRFDQRPENHRMWFGDLPPPTWRYRHTPRPSPPDKTARTTRKP